MWTQRRSGQSHQRSQEDHRDPYERDKTRVIHCPAFRRLQRKTQILGTDEGDFHRTRLTHSLEVASIGCSIVRNLRKQAHHQEILSILPPDDLISVICLLHDIGHPPFGHGGEVALNYMMRNAGGFEGNAQTLRLITKLENSYGAFGLDLTRRTMLGVLKYPIVRSKVVATEFPAVRSGLNYSMRINDWLPPKSYFDSEQYEVEWILAPFSENDQALFQSLQRQPDANNHGKTAYHNLDCSLMNVADDIAYGVHDLEDAIHLRLIQMQHLDTPLFRQLLTDTLWCKDPHHFLNSLFDPAIAVRKQAIGDLVNYFITETVIQITNNDFEHGLLRYNALLQPAAQQLLNALMTCIYQNVIDSQEARTFEYGGQMVVQRLFEAFSSNPGSLLDHKNRLLYGQTDDDLSAMRVICDYIANMTDEYAYRMHERLFGFNTRTIFERL